MKKSTSADEIFKRNETESKKLETLVNSLGNMNENIKKRIISHISKTPNVKSSSNSVKSSSTFESLLKKYDFNQNSKIFLKTPKTNSLLKKSISKPDFIEAKNEPNFVSSIPLNKNYKTFLTNRPSNTNLKEYKKQQILTGSLLSKNLTQIPSINNSNFKNNNKDIINIDDSLNDNLTLTLNNNDINNGILNKDSSNNFISPSKQFTTPVNSKKNLNSQLNQNISSNNAKPLDKGKYSYLHFLNDEPSLNKKYSETLSVKSAKSSKYEDFLKSPVNTPSKLINGKDASPLLSSSYNYKLPITAYSANSFFEKSKGSSLTVNNEKKPSDSPILFDFIKELENEEPLISDVNHLNNLNDDNSSLKLEINSPLQQNNAYSPIINTNDIKKSNSIDSNSRKRPANQTSESDEKNEDDQSLIILSDISNQNSSEKISSNKKTKIKSPGSSNSVISSRPSTSKINNNNTIYSENEIENIKRKLKEQYEKQLEDAKKDCMEWEQKCIESNNKHKEIESVLEEYEVTITRMIQDSQKEKERQESRINELLEERSYLQESSEIMETSFKELRLKFEEFKTQNEIFSKNEELMKQTITSLQNDVLCASQRYEQIKAHAEEKLEMANIEIAKVRNNFEKELSAMKAKLLRKELDSQSLNQKIKALQEQINIKTKENEELATICDALVSKLEN